MLGLNLFMSNKKIYYLRKYQRLMYTSKKENAPAVIDIIDSSDVVHGRFTEDDAPFVCMKYEFFKVFKSKPSV